MNPIQTKHKTMKRQRAPKKQRGRAALENPAFIFRELNNRSLYQFIQFFWPEVSSHPFVPNWHIEYLCTELEKMAYQVAERKPREHDLLINIPPGTTKTITCSIMFPVWCWTKWYWMRFITASYSGALALESAEYSRDLIRSEKFKALYPDLAIKEDKDTKSNFKVIKKYRDPSRKSVGGGWSQIPGGNRFSTSVGGTMTGFHGDILVVDDPLNPYQAVSEVELKNSTRWMDNTLSTRKTNKAVSTTITVMQRLHEDDPSGHMLSKKKANLRHICLPGEIRNYREQLTPSHLAENYVDDLLDPVRMNWEVLRDMEADLGQYGFSGQVGQKPTPPGGGMFKTDNFQFVDRISGENLIEAKVRYWDKAGSQGQGAYTVGVKMYRLKGGKFLVVDVKRGQWSSEVRESIIEATAEADGKDVFIYVEQEPGSGGKESAEATIRRLAGFSCYADRPTGDKTYRADPYSVQVNNGNVWLLRGEWNHEFVMEHANFPYGKYKDQVDGGSGAFGRLTERKRVKIG